VSTVTKIETATDTNFPGAFVKALAFPHLDAPTPNLSAVVDLPPPTEGIDGIGGNGGPSTGRRRGGRRRRVATTKGDDNG
jgi:uncharacterized 2Fe-2S/4Fe-4S cluster protein (DUF4445 family)